MTTTEIDIYDGDDEDVIPLTRDEIKEICASAYVDCMTCGEDDEKATATVATCRDITPAVYSGVIFTCSERGAITYLIGEGEESTVCGGELNFCPNCGRMVVE